MKCPQCDLPEAPIDGGEFCTARFLRDGSEEIACLRRALANRDGEIANAAHILDSSGASKTSKDGAMLTLADRIATLHTSTIRRAHEAQESAAFIGAQHRMVWSALGGLDEESALDAAHRVRSEVTRLESLLAIERGHTAALESNESHWIAELDATRARLTAAETARAAAEGDAERMREVCAAEADRFAASAAGMALKVGRLGGYADRCDEAQQIAAAIRALSPPTGHAAGETLLDEIAKERKRQEAKWGEQNAHFRLGDWMSCLGNIALKARAKSDLPGETRRELVKLAALVMRASDANGGHAAGEVDDEDLVPCVDCSTNVHPSNAETHCAVALPAPPPVDERPAGPSTRPDGSPWVGGVCYCGGIQHTRGANCP